MRHRVFLVCFSCSCPEQSHGQVRPYKALANLSNFTRAIQFVIVGGMKAIISFGLLFFGVPFANAGESFCFKPGYIASLTFEGWTKEPQKLKVTSYSSERGFGETQTVSFPKSSGLRGIRCSEKQVELISGTDLYIVEIINNSKLGKPLKSEVPESAIASISDEGVRPSKDFEGFYREKDIFLPVPDDSSSIFELGLEKREVPTEEGNATIVFQVVVQKDKKTKKDLSRFNIYEEFNPPRPTKVVVPAEVVFAYYITICSQKCPAPIDEIKAINVMPGDPEAGVRTMEESYYFSKFAIKGNEMTFETKSIRGISYRFSGKFLVDPSKVSQFEGKSVLRGKFFRTRIPEKEISAEGDFTYFGGF